MTTYNTGNPIGSKDPRDLYDNAENLDTAVNDVENDTWKDRFGRSRKTMSGMERQFDAAEDYREAAFDLTQADRDARFNNFIASSGYQFLGDYAAGIEITEYNQIVRDANGEFWRLSGQVELPYTTTGDWGDEEALFVAVGDAALRQELANLDMGAAMVARGVVAVDSIADLLALPDGQRKEGLRYLVKGYHTGTDVGGGEFYWDSNRVGENDGGITLNGFVRIVGEDGRADIRWFGGDIFKATEYVKEDKYRVLIGHPGEVYDYSGTAPMFLNRLICNGGSCTVRIIGDADLRLSNVDDDLVVFNGVNLYFSGNRRGLDRVGQRLITGAPAPIHSLRLKNFEVRALLDIDDIDSWSDDVGKTRGVLNFSVEVSKDSVCEDVTFYGTSGLAIRASSPDATHREERITGYNCETLVWIGGTVEWRKGTSKHLHIENTADERTYWIGMDTGTGINGKNALLCEPDHRDIYEIENITSNNAIERTVYCQSSNVMFRGGYSNLSRSSAFQLRRASGFTSNVNAEQFRVIAKYEGTSRSPYIGLYSLTGGSFRTMNVENITPSSPGSPLVSFSVRNNNIVVDDATCISSGKIMQLGSTWEGESSNLVFKNITTIDDYNYGRLWSGNIFSTYTPGGENYSSRDVRLENIKMLLSTDTPLYLDAFNPAVDAKGIRGFSIVGCTAYFRIGAILNLDDCVDVSVTGSKFLGVMPNNLRYDQIMDQINRTSPLNEFDFRVVLRDDHLSRDQGLVSVLEYSKPYSIEPSNISEYLQRFTTTIPYEGGAGTWYSGPASGKDLSVKVMYGSDYLIAEKGESDGSLSVIEISGDTLTTTYSERVDKLYVGINPSAGLIELITTNESLEARPLSIDIRYVIPR